jgi:hypothetical protein
MTTKKKLQVKCSGKLNGSKQLSPDGSSAYLRLRKDNLTIPREFYMKSAIGEYELEFDGMRRHPLVPPLNLPRNAVEDWRH